jgi:hypothetical protein
MPTLEKAKICLFDFSLAGKKGSGVKRLSEFEEKLILRWRGIWTYWYENPQKLEKDIVAYIMSEFDLGKTRAYEELQNVKELMGNIKHPAKAFHRHVVKEMALESFQRAKEKDDPMAMVSATDKYGKYTGCDHDEEESLPWDKIVPPTFEISDDIAILNPALVTPDIEALRAKLRAKLSNAASIAEDTPYEEIPANTTR